MGRSPVSGGTGLKKGPWTPEEDQKLVQYIEKNGIGSWRALPKHAGLNRCGKSCRLRWTNYLRPDIKRGKFSEEEEQKILNLHATLGNKWSAIASHLPGRTDNEVKNFWNTRLKKKLIQMGYDPITHQPQTNNNNIFSGLSNLLALASLKELLDHQLATLQQCLQQLQPHQEALSNYTSSSTNSYFGIGGHNQLLVNNNDGAFSHQLSHGESCTNSPWIFSCSSTTPPSSTSSLTNIVADNNCIDAAAAIWPETLVEDPFFNAIA